jgi:hypothetical protein
MEKDIVIHSDRCVTITDKHTSLKGSTFDEDAISASLITRILQHLMVVTLILPDGEDKRINRVGVHKLIRPQVRPPGGLWDPGSKQHVEGVAGIQTEVIIHLLQDSRVEIMSERSIYINRPACERMVETGVTLREVDGALGVTFSALTVGACIDLDDAIRGISCLELPEFGAKPLVVGGLLS